MNIQKMHVYVKPKAQTKLHLRRKFEKKKFYAVVYCCDWNKTSLIKLVISFVWKP